MKPKSVQEKEFDKKIQKSHGDLMIMKGNTGIWTEKKPERKESEKKRESRTSGR